MAMPNPKCPKCETPMKHAMDYTGATGFADVPHFYCLGCRKVVWEEDAQDDYIVQLEGENARLQERAAGLEKAVADFGKFLQFEIDGSHRHIKQALQYINDSNPDEFDFYVLNKSSEMARESGWLSCLKKCQKMLTEKMNEASE